MPKQVYDQYRSELRQGKAKPWYDFSDLLPVWEGTLPGTPEDASWITTELAKDMTPVVGPYRSGVRSTQEYNKMMSLLDEGDYTGAIAPGVWSLLESADANLSVLPLVGGILAAPIDIARAARPIFTSPAQKAISEVTKDAMPSQQWLRQLEGRGVKKDEMEWTGLHDFLKGRKGNIPKSEVEDFIEANKIEVQEVHYAGRGSEEYPGDLRMTWVEQEMDSGNWEVMKLGDDPDTFADELAAGYSKDDYVINNVYGEYLYDEGGRLKIFGSEREAFDDLRYTIEEQANRMPEEELKELLGYGGWRENVSGPTKYSNPSLQLPGGENYRELVLTLPDKQGDISLPEGWTIREATPKAPIGNQDFGYVVFDEKGLPIIGGHTKNDAITESLRFKGYRDAPAFTGGHFPEDNILAHIRFNERVDPDGNKVLFIEEMQSDWSQKGRKQGFIDESKLVKELPEGFTVEELPPAVGFKKEYTPRWRILDPSGDQVTAQFASPNRESAVNVAINWYNNHHVRGKGVPRAPFLEDTNQWVNLSLKRMIRWAADNDFDSIGWTTGKQQAARYNLSKHIRAINAEKIESGWKLEIVPHNAGTGPAFLPVSETVYSGKDDLSDYVGKELAEKIEKNKGGMFRDLDLEIGGEGMAGFYDDIVVNQARKIGKKHGAKVEKGHADAGMARRGITEDESNEMYPSVIWRITVGDEIDKTIPAFDTFEEAQEYLLKTDPDDVPGTVWKMKLTDKLKQAAKEGLPYYALVPPSLLAIGAQQERQSLLE